MSNPVGTFQWLFSELKMRPIYLIWIKLLCIHRQIGSLLTQ